jgi:DNA-binding beta-propeller fold protein YncE/chitodextrinase
MAYLVGVVGFLWAVPFGFVTPAWAVHTNLGSFSEHADIASCAHCHGVTITGANPVAPVNRIITTSGGHSHVRQTDWTSIVNTMTAKGSPSIPSTQISYLNTYYCSTCGNPTWWALTAGSITETSATISWTTRDPQGTVLYFGTDPDPNNLTIYTSIPALVTAHSVNVTGLSSFTTYYYYVGPISDRGRSFTPPGIQGDGAGGFKQYAAKFKTLDLTPPTAPTNLHTTAITFTEIDIAWNASTDNVGINSYEVYRKKSSDATFDLVGTTDALTLTFAIINLKPGTSYDFEARAKDGAGNFSTFATLTALTTPDTTPPTTPANLHATNITKTRIDIAWNASTDIGGSGIAGYEVYRKKTSDTSFSLVAFTTAVSLNNINLLPDTSYDFEVRAKDLADNFSDFTPVLTAKTLTDVVEGCVPPVPSRLYLSDRTSSDFKIVPIDLDSATNIYKNVLPPIPVASTPGNIAANPKGKTVYAVVGTDLAVIDVATNTVLDTVPIGGVVDTHQVVVSPDGQNVYVAYRQTPGSTLQIQVINATTNTPVGNLDLTNPSFAGCYLPIGLGIDPTGNPLYVACRDIDSTKPDRFFAIDPTANPPTILGQSTFNKDSNFGFINAMAVRPDGVRVYVTRTDTIASKVEVFRGVGDTGPVGDHLKSIALPSKSTPRAAVATLDNAYLYVVDQALGTLVISIVADTGGAYVRTLSRLTSFGFDIALNPDGTQIYPSHLNSLFAWTINSDGSNTYLTTVTGGFTNGYQLTITPGAPTGVCHVPTPSRLYFSERNTTSPAIVPVDLDTNGLYTQVKAPIPVQGLPAELAPHPNGQFVYAITGNSDLTVIDVVTNTVLNRVPVAGGLLGNNQLVVSADGKKLYIAYRPPRFLEFRVKIYDIDLDPTSPTLTDIIINSSFKGCITPIGLGVDPTGSGRLYVACRDSSSTLPDRFFVIDTTTDPPTHTLGSTFAKDSNLSFINALAVRPDGAKVYLARLNSLKSTVEVFDGATGADLKSIALPSSTVPRAAVATMDNAKLYVADSALGTHVIDASSDSYVKTLNRLTSWGFDIALTPDGMHVYTLRLNKLYGWDITTAPAESLAATVPILSYGYIDTITPGAP